MQLTRPQQDSLHGLVGGLLAGLVVALWFLLVDILTTEPFRTPAFLASILLGDEYVGPDFRLALTYSVLHFGVFAVLGIAISWFLRSIDSHPGLLTGLVFGIGVLNGVHYGGFLVTDVDLLTVLPVGHVLGANLAGGMALMAYLHWGWREQRPLGWKVLEHHPLILKGIGTGLLGAGAVALWFLVIDIMTSVPFFTPAALGSAVFLGASGPDEVQLNLGIVAAYTVLHVVAFILVGIAFVWVAARLERTPGLWLLPFLGFVVLEGLFLGVVGVVSQWVLGALGWWTVGVGNLLAVGVMGRWVWQTHPMLRDRLSGRPVETRV